MRIHFRVICISALSFYLSTRNMQAQEIRNFGAAQIHENAQMGFFNDLTNDGTLFGNSGLVGFYGSHSLLLSGAQIPIVFDLEIANENGLYLDIPVVVNNNLNFIYGDILSDRNEPHNFLELSSEAYHQGESNFSKIDGFIQTTVNESYLFPTGDESLLRPLAVSEVPANTILKCAYFYEQPNTVFQDLENNHPEINTISKNEFWVLSGKEPVKVTLSWDERSALYALTPQIQNLTIVGFHKANKKWLELGSVESSGTLTEGFITSDQLVPDHYEAFTFGSLHEKSAQTLKAQHYLVTPNGDGINDYLYIPELENYGNNRVMIFNRSGRKVFDKENYSNEFGGTYTLNAPTLNRDDGLPAGVYFYIVYLIDEELKLQGFLYLDR